MSYLTEDEILRIQENVRLLSISDVDDVSHFVFDSEIEEYNDFLKIAKVPYASIPALKVGKLAVNKKLTERAKRKGYGSFMLEMARAFAFEMNELGIACRFITVDADIEYNSNTPDFYLKNGFVENLKNKRKNPGHTISMRKDIFVDEEEL